MLRRWRTTGSVSPPPRRISSSKSSADGPSPHNEPADDSETRSLASVTRARRQPSPSVPTKFSTGIRTLSKNTWLKEWAVVASMIGVIVSPGRFVGQMKYEMPLCFGRSGSVRAMRIPNLDT